MAEKISVQIELEGGKEVEQQLAAIGVAGNKAFAGLNQAGSTAADGITKAGEASQQTGEQLNTVQGSADKASESMSRFSLETVKTSVEIAAATSKIALHGVEIVQAVRHHQTLIQSLVRLVSGANTAAKALSLMAPELTLIGAGALAIATPIAQAVVAFEALEKLATKFAASAEKMNNTLQTLAATSGQSFEKLQQGEAVFGQIGIKAETFRGTVAKIGDTLATVDTKNLTSGMQDIVAVVNEIAAGQKGITFADWVTAEDKVKGVSIAMKQAADSGKDATQVLLGFIRSADLATAIKIGAAFGLSEADVDRVRRLKENISDLVQRIQGAGPLISPESAAAFDQMRTSIVNADSAWARLKQSITTVDFSAMAASLSSTMNDIKALVLNGAASISEGMGQAFRGMSKQAASDVAAIGAALRDLAALTGTLSFFQSFGTQARQAVSGANAAIAEFTGAIMRGMGASEASILAVTNSINGIKPAADAAGQSAQTAGVAFTAWGATAQQGVNTAKAGVQQTAAQFTSFGAVASQSAATADQAMQQAAGGATTLGTAIQSGSDKAAEFASSLATITWDAISDTAVAAWNALTGAIGPAATAVTDFVGKIASITWDAISGAGVAAWNALTGAIERAISAQSRFNATPSGGGASAAGGAPGKARGGLLGGRGTGTSDSNLAWVSRGEYIMPAGAVRQPGVLAFLEALRRSGNLPGFAKGGAVGGGYTIVAEGAFDQSLMNVAEKLQQIVENLRNLQFEFLQSTEVIMENLRNLQFEILQGARHAHGGLLGGRGTGTSDSNLAWVSRGEHIMPASAVRQPGVLAFLEALRRSGGNLSRVLDGMGRFALGGMVPRAIPAFAGGGLAGGMNNVTIQFPGLPAIGGLRASSDVVDQLHKAAALAQVRSGGRKPSRYS